MRTNRMVRTHHPVARRRPTGQSVCINITKAGWSDLDGRSNFCTIRSVREATRNAITREVSTLLGTFRLRPLCKYSHE